MYQARPESNSLPVIKVSVCGAEVMSSTVSSLSHSTQDIYSILRGDILVSMAARSI